MKNQDKQTKILSNERIIHTGRFLTHHNPEGLVFFIPQNECVQIYSVELTQSDGTHFVKQQVDVREEVWGQGTMQSL